MKRFYILLLFVLLLGSVFYLIGSRNKKDTISILTNPIETDTFEERILHPLQIDQMRNQKYPGSDITIQESLSGGNGFARYIVSYYSDNFIIKGLLAVPDGEKPSGGWPAIIFNHGYIKPEEYRREAKYASYVSGLAQSGFVVFMPDFRGHQDSEGNPLGAYFSPAYTTDSLNAFYSLTKYPDVNPQRIGMWGHSMGGNITLRSMVVSKDIKAGVIWAGVVASYEDMATKWRRSEHWSPSAKENISDRPDRVDLENVYGNISVNPDFWRSISPIYFVSDISGPIQLHHGLDDASVPWEFSQSLKDALEEKGKYVEYYTYEGANHNLSGSSFDPAIDLTVEFFNKFLK